jgi:hypothetical protein
MPASMRNPHPKLLEEGRQVLRLHHDSIHTERSSMEWIVRLVHVHGVQSREHFFPAEPKIESLLTALSVATISRSYRKTMALNCMHRTEAEDPLSKRSEDDA